MGAPFFRNVTVSLDFIDAAITISSKEVDSPISPDNHYPVWNDSNTFHTELELLTNGQYAGGAYFGTPIQGDSQYTAYSTSSYWTVIPEANNS